MTSKKVSSKEKSVRKASAVENGVSTTSPPEETTELSKQLSTLLAEYVTTKVAAERLGVVTEHINHLLAKKKLNGIKMGYAWLVYIPSIEKYIKTKSPSGRPRSGTPQIEIQK